MKILKILFTSDLRDKLLFSLLMILLFRILSHIPVPFVDTTNLVLMGSSDITGLLNIFSGGALHNFTIMATGISAYISASIVIQLLSYFVPAVHMMVRSPGGDKKVKKITIILGIIVALISSVITTRTMNSYYNLLTNDSWYVYLIIAILHACGTGIAIFIGESITERGFGNGMSLLVCINVLSSIPSTITKISESNVNLFPLLTMISFAIVVILLTIVAETSERKIPLFYPKAAARGQYSKDAMSYPIKLNVSGVMPIIFASYVIQLFALLAKMDNFIGTFFSNIIVSDSIVYIVLFTVLIFGFTYLYALISFDAKEVSENIQKNGAVIPSIRPGKDTANYISDVRKSITRISAIYLSFIYFVPTLILTMLSVNYITATSIIILVGVSIETCKALKVEIQLRDYKTL